MTHQQAINLVLRSAEAWANGHGQAREILRAVEQVRQILNVFQDGLRYRSKRGKKEAK